MEVGGPWWFEGLEKEMILRVWVFKTLAARYPSNLSL